ncbi:peptidase C39 family protein [Hyalangium rubrum]|uniref:Peptidase C39 family protein n=1 Tax=Hyalangium rubrum TaxID=3103134 RepID=A0ABU5H9W5_9BACT|nr:peptidase C39 family protein [Hyalangium sp. s54d21]MDY7230115.1 peptidase C39 family protein [Hyalangium sp. s54d21]
MRTRIICLLLTALLTACAGMSRSSGGSEEKEGPVARLWRINAAQRDFERLTREGTTLASDGALELDAAARPGATPFPSAGQPDAPVIATYRVGTAVLAEQPIAEGFTSAVPSLEALTPPGTWVRVTLSARVEGTWTKDYDFGPWAFDKGTVSRRSVSGQEDSHGNVLTDTLVLKQPADAVRMTVWLYSTQPEVSPRVRALSLAVSDKERTPVDGPSDGATWGTVLEVPGLSQMIYPNGGPVWCSPTSTTMVLGYWARKLGRPELAHTVPTAAEHTYDEVYAGTGNWSFNTAYGSAMGGGALHGMVARFDSFAQVERFIAAGIPVIISIAYKPGTLTGGASYSSNGHLIVVKGFSPQGDVVVNDPAFPSDDKVEMTYRRDELWRAWRHSGGAAYLFWPQGTSLPEGALSAVP